MRRVEMRPKTRSKKMQILITSIAILSFVQQVSSWHMLEQIDPSSSQQQQQQLQQQTLLAPANTFSIATHNAGPTTAGEQFVGPNSSNSNQQQEPQAAAPLPAPNSTAGKILDSSSLLLSNTLANAATSLIEASQSSGTKRPEIEQKQSSPTVNIVRYMLKPRKSSAGDSTVKDVEQQIIQQHARVQHLKPSRKLSSAPSFAAESDGRDSSALSSILDNFKSGITSRSSIVKAISDNRLARTLSDVGKTIGSNKYVAGAAAASALAALGLAVSKLMTPYMFAGSFPSAGLETLMPSGSSAAENYFNPNPARLSYGDGFSAASSMPPMGFSTPYVPLSSQQYQLLSPHVEQSRPPSSPYLDTASSSSQATYYSSPAVYLQSPSLDSNGKPRELFITYTQKPSPPPPSSSSSAVDTLNGYYTNYYNGQSVDPASSNSFNSQYNQPQNQNNYNEQPQSHEYQSYNRVGQSNNGPQQTSGSSPDLMNSADPMPSASVQMASYVTPSNQLVRLAPTRSPASASGHTGRRFGVVSLKLKDSDKARTVKASKQLEYAWPIFVKAENYPHVGHKTQDSMVVGNGGGNQDSDQSGKSNPFQQRQKNQMMPLVGKDQGQQQQQQQVNSNNNAAFNIIKPMGRQTTLDKPEVERRRSSDSARISIHQQQARSSGPNMVDHHNQEASSSAATASNTAASLERVFRTTENVVKGFDYDSPPAETFEKGQLLTSGSSWQRLLSDDMSASELNNNNNNSNDNNNNNVIKPIEVTNTKSGSKLVGGGGGGGQQTQRKQQSSQLESSSSAGGLNIMAPPRQLLHPAHHHHQLGDGYTSMSQPSPATTGEVDSQADGNGDESASSPAVEQSVTGTTTTTTTTPTTVAQRRGQSSIQGNLSDSEEDPSAS